MQHHCDGSSLLHATARLRHQQVEIGSTLEQSGLLIRHRQVLYQPAQPGVVQRDHDLIRDGFEDDNIAGIPAAADRLRQHQNAYLVRTVAEGQCEQRSDAELGKGFSHRLQFRSDRRVSQGQCPASNREVLDGPHQFCQRRGTARLHAVRTELLHRGGRQSRLAGSGNTAICLPLRSNFIDCGTHDGVRIALPVKLCG